MSALASNRLCKLLFWWCENAEVEKLILGLEDMNPHYRLLAMLV
jgi:hypothetical protein